MKLAPRYEHSAKRISRAAFLIAPSAPKSPTPCCTTTASRTLCSCKDECGSRTTTEIDRSFMSVTVTLISLARSARRKSAKSFSARSPTRSVASIGGPSALASPLLFILNTGASRPMLPNCFANNSFTSWARTPAVQRTENSPTAVTTRNFHCRRSILPSINLEVDSFAGKRSTYFTKSSLRSAMSISSSSCRVTSRCAQLFDVLLSSELALSASSSVLSPMYQLLDKINLRSSDAEYAHRFRSCQKGETRRCEDASCLPVSSAASAMLGGTRSLRPSSCSGTDVRVLHPRCRRRRSRNSSVLRTHRDPAKMGKMRTTE
mmetsp:Transcript_183237/g.580992  ORF Transcript_183237/g.580992 Transcript_183237/m.580992 type:complete len:319 (+) Transcript_183237:193-1149(+)